MEDDSFDRTEPSEEIAEAYRRFGRARAKLHRERIETAAGRLAGTLATHGIDRSAIAEAAARVEASVPERLRIEFAGMTEELAVPETDLRVYAFGTSAFQDALSPGGAPEAGGPGEGCSNLLVPAERSASSPLVLKNRDIKSRGFRPQVVLEIPPLGPYNGFLTTTTAGNVLLYQGVNDAGLVVANTFVDNRREGVSETDRLRNGVVVRDLLERCDSVEEAVDRTRALPTENAKGLTLFLADGAGAEVLEVDPADQRVEAVADGVTPRTNHFPGKEENHGSSTTLRLRRLRELVAELPPRIEPRDLDRVARDHRHGPGSNSICRHPTTGSGDPESLTESTTVGSAVFVGGEGRMRAVQGNPCEYRPTSYRLRHDSLAAFEERAAIADR